MLKTNSTSVRATESRGCFHFSDQVHNQNAYVRDFYFFRRNFYPQLSLVKMDPEDASLALQRRVGAGCVKKTRLPGLFHREGLVLNEGCNKHQVIWPVLQRRVHARGSAKTRLYGLFHREGSMLKTRLPGHFHREGSMVCFTKKGRCWRL